MSDYKKFKVGIIDLGFNNTFSIFNIFKNIGCRVSKLETIDGNRNDLVVLPGVGSFKEGVENLKKQKLFSKLQDFSLNEGNKILGICLGMQLLFSKSNEFGNSKGLNIIHGEIKKLPKNNMIPNIGWNKIHVKKKSLIYRGLDKKFFYFVHSFYCIPFDKKIISSTTKLNKFEFCSSIELKNIIGVQFHPEKSSVDGRRLIMNILGKL
jgi:glutamine amidotransferase